MNDIPRNMPDDLMRKLAAKGGVFGFQIGNEFHNREGVRVGARRMPARLFGTPARSPRAARMSIAEIDKLVAPQFPMKPAEIPAGHPADGGRLGRGGRDRRWRLVGEDHVSLGSDFDGGPPPPRGMRDVRDLPMITDAMLRRGWPEARIQKFLGGNLLRVFRKITEKK